MTEAFNKWTAKVIDEMPSKLADDLFYDSTYSKNTAQFWILAFIREVRKEAECLVHGSPERDLHDAFENITEEFNLEDKGR